MILGFCGVPLIVRPPPCSSGRIHKMETIRPRMQGVERQRFARPCTPRGGPCTKSRSFAPVCLLAVLGL